MPWPTRTAICLDCRSTLGPGRVCHAAHRTRALTEPAQREHLLATVWGPPDRRQRMLAYLRAGATGGATGGGLGSLGDCGGCNFGGGADGIEAIVVLVVVGALVFLIGKWVVERIARWIAGWRAMITPVGAPAPPPTIVGRGRVGTIVGPTLPSPVSGFSCVAFVARLVHGRRAVMLHDAATAGFEVALDDGTRLRVPAGVLRVDGAVPLTLRLSAHHVDEYLRTINPAGRAADDLDPFPYDRVEETLIHPGDRVEVVGPTRLRLLGPAQ